jgi:hypothetical protein
LASVAGLDNKRFQHSSKPPTLAAIFNPIRFMKFLLFALLVSTMISCEEKHSHKDALIFLNSVYDSPEFDSAMSKLIVRVLDLKTNDLADNKIKIDNRVVDSFKIQNANILKNINEKIDQLNLLDEFDKEIDLKSKSLEYHFFLKKRYNHYAKLIDILPTGFEILTPEQKKIHSDGKAIEEEGNQTGRIYAEAIGAFIEKYNITDSEFK